VTPRTVPATPVCGETATRITIDVPREALFLLSGVPGLSPGPIGTVVSRPRLLYPGEMISIGLRESDGYFLKRLAPLLMSSAGRC
jgi:hypothetical protein